MMGWGDRERREQHACVYNYLTRTRRRRQGVKQPAGFVYFLTAKDETTREDTTLDLKIFKACVGNHFAHILLKKGWRKTVSYFSRRVAVLCGFRKNHRSAPQYMPALIYWLIGSLTHGQSVSQSVVCRQKNAEMFWWLFFSSFTPLPVWKSSIPQAEQITGN